MKPWHSDASFGVLADEAALQSFGIPFQRFCLIRRRLHVRVPLIQVLPLRCQNRFDLAGASLDLHQARAYRFLLFLVILVEIEFKVGPRRLKLDGVVRLFEVVEGLHFGVLTTAALRQVLLLNMVLLGTDIAIVQQLLVLLRLLLNLLDFLMLVVDVQLEGGVPGLLSKELTLRYFLDVAFEDADFIVSSLNEFALAGRILFLRTLLLIRKEVLYLVDLLHWAGVVDGGDGFFLALLVVVRVHDFKVVVPDQGVVIACSACCLVRLILNMYRLRRRHLFLILVISRI